MNNDLVMVKDIGQWGNLNKKIIGGPLKVTMTYKTIEVLLLAYIFSKHDNHDDMCDALWGLVNPEQSKFVTCERVGKFIEKLQKIAIDFPLEAEKINSKASGNKKIQTYLEEAQSVKQEMLDQIMTEIYANAAVNKKG